jgi:hypothetical protein
VACCSHASRQCGPTSGTADELRTRATAARATAAPALDLDCSEGRQRHVTAALPSKFGTPLAVPRPDSALLLSPGVSSDGISLTATATPSYALSAGIAALGLPFLALSRRLTVGGARLGTSVAPAPQPA